MFWKVQGSPVTYSQLKGFQFHDGDNGEEDAKFDLPNELSSGVYIDLIGINNELRAGVNYSGIVGSIYTAKNPYNYSFVESLDFKVENSEGFDTYVKYSNKALKAFLMSCFLDPELSVSRFDAGGGNISFYELDLPSYGLKARLNEYGNPTITQLNEVSLDPFLMLHLKGFYIQQFILINTLMTIMFFAGNGVSVDEAASLEVNRSPKAVGAFYDSAFSLPSFVSSQAIETIDSLKDTGNFSGIHFADFDPIYNFLSTNYEIAIGNDNVATSRLANIYHEIKKLNETGNDGVVGHGEYLEGVLAGGSQVSYWAQYFDKLKEAGVELSSVNHLFNHVFVQPKTNILIKSLINIKKLFQCILISNSDHILASKKL